jgi:hypothetical protein
MIEDAFHLGGQAGSTHLDKFIFILLARCQESVSSRSNSHCKFQYRNFLQHLDTFLNTLIAEANKDAAARETDVDELISRVVRSVIRIFTISCAMSTSATSLVSEAVSSSASALTKQYSTSVTGAGTAGQAKGAHATYRAVAISGMLSLVSGRLPISHTAPLKESKAKRSLNNFGLRTRRLFQVRCSLYLAGG